LQCSDRAARRERHHRSWRLGHGLLPARRLMCCVGPTHPWHPPCGTCTAMRVEIFSTCAQSCDGDAATFARRVAQMISSSIASGPSRGSRTSWPRRMDGEVPAGIVPSEGVAENPSGSKRARRFCAHVGSSMTTKYVQVRFGPANILMLWTRLPYQGATAKAVPPPVWAGHALWWCRRQAGRACCPPSNTPVRRCRRRRCAQTRRSAQQIEASLQRAAGRYSLVCPVLTALG